MGPRTTQKRTREVAISEFKAKCHLLLDEVNKTKAPLRVTRRGKTIAQVIPPPPAPAEKDWLGSMSDRLEITGDIVSPVIETHEIKAVED